MLSTNLGLKVLFNSQIFSCPFLENIECFQSIIDVNDYTLWIATTEGLYHMEYRVDKNENLAFKLLELYNKTDGLPANSIKNVIQVDRFVYAITSSGVSKIDTRIIPMKRYSIPIHIDNIYVNEKLIQKLI